MTTPRSVLALCATAAVLASGMALVAQSPAGSVGPRPQVGPSDRPVIFDVAVARGAKVWQADCVTCHGASARGSDKVPTLIRSLLILRDRQGSELGPFLKKGHPTQSGRSSASIPEGDVADLMQFIRQRINDTLRGSPVFVPGNILTGDAKAGEAYFRGAGGCTKCHSVDGDFRAVGGRYSNPVDLQQRMLFPLPARGRGAGPNRTAITAVITPASGAALTGVLVDEDDFFITVRDAAGNLQTVRKTAAMKIAITDPLRAHREWLDRVTDTQIHDLVAYLVTVK
jgi:cytochrome c oxidase cbb3-type subunit III